MTGREFSPASAKTVVTKFAKNASVDISVSVSASVSVSRIVAIFCRSSHFRLRLERPKYDLFVEVVRGLQIGLNYSLLTAAH